MSDKDFTQGKPAFYAVLYPSMKEVATNCGYTLAIHGSTARDMDLIAVPWVEDPKSVSTLVSELNKCLGNTVWSEHNLTNKETKPHGRVSYTLSIGGNWFIDLSVTPPKSSNFSMNGLQKNLDNSLFYFAQELQEALIEEKNEIRFNHFYENMDRLQSRFDELKQAVGITCCIIDEKTGICHAEKLGDEEGVSIEFVKQDD
jgi:hypothetical protein